MGARRNDPYAVSDWLTKIRTMLAEFERTGIHLSGEQVGDVRAILLKLQFKALRLEHEVSRLRWNEAARNDRARLVAEGG